MKITRIAVGFLVLLICIPILQNATAQETTGETFSDDFSTDAGAWTYLGDAHRDATEQNVVLTNTDFGQAGVAFLKTPVTGTFTANFSYKMGGGYNSADGITLFFYKQKLTSLDSGGSLGFSSLYGGVPGYGVELDTWQNPAIEFQKSGEGHPDAQADPNNSHIALIQNYAGNHLTSVGFPQISDGNWHNIAVDVKESAVYLYFDNRYILQWSGTFDRTYDCFGFSGSTGQCSDIHLLDNVTVTTPSYMQTPLKSPDAPFVVPEYPFGASMALVSCVVAFIIFKRFTNKTVGGTVHKI